MIAVAPYVNIRNIAVLSYIGSFLTMGVIAAVIASPLFWCPTVCVAFYVPEALSEID